MPAPGRPRYAAATKASTYDLLIRNVQILDGTAAARPGDLGVKDGRILDLGDILAVLPSG